MRTRESLSKIKFPLRSKLWIPLNSRVLSDIMRQRNCIHRTVGICWKIVILWIRIFLHTRYIIKAFPIRWNYYSDRWIYLQQWSEIFAIMASLLADAIVPECVVLCIFQKAHFPSPKSIANVSRNRQALFVEQARNSTMVKRFKWN